MVEGVELEYDFNDPRNDLVNIWGIMRAAARLVQAVVATDNEWGSDAHKQDMQQAWKVSFYFGYRTEIQSKFIFLIYNLGVDTEGPYLA